MSQTLRTPLVVAADEPLSDLSLDQLSEIANSAHTEAEGAALKCGSIMAGAVQHAIRAGSALAEVKYRVGHGKFLAWLEGNFRGSEDIAQKYMRVFRNQEKLESNTASARYLTIDGCLKLLSSGKKDPALGGAVSESEDYDSDEWYTPSEHIEAARLVLGEIDLDPASCKIANKVVGATKYFTRKDDGLSKDWVGRVWLNPPYSQPLASQFGAKLIAEIDAGHTVAAVMVQNASTDTGWFHDLASRSLVCLTRGRINFNREDGGSAANRYGQAFFYFGDNGELFKQTFGSFGLVGEMR